VTKLGAKGRASTLAGIFLLPPVVRLSQKPSPELLRLDEPGGRTLSAAFTSDALGETTLFMGGGLPDTVGQAQLTRPSLLGGHAAHILLIN
jgi:hypothetical protein